MFNKYTRIARVYPAILCSIPIFTLNFFLLSKYTSDFFKSIEIIKLTGGITLSVALTFLLAHIGRFIGKELFEKIHFNNESSMPTTKMLMHSNSEYSVDFKNKIHSKIFIDFGMKISHLEDELKNKDEATKIIAESVSMIRAKVGKGKLLFQHNIEYGFARNLIGGSVPAIFLSIINSFIFGLIVKNYLAYNISISLSLIYFIIIFFGRSIIERYGNRYAKILIQEYLSN